MKEKGEKRMNRHIIALGTALLTLVSGLCLAGLKAIDKKIERENEKKKPQ